MTFRRASDDALVNIPSRHRSSQRVIRESFSKVRTEAGHLTNSQPIGAAHVLNHMLGGWESQGIGPSRPKQTQNLLRTSQGLPRSDLITMSNTFAPGERGWLMANDREGVEFGPKRSSTSSLTMKSLRKKKKKKGANVNVRASTVTGSTNPSMNQSSTFEARMQVLQRNRNRQTLTQTENAASIQEQRQEFVESVPFFQDCSFGFKRYVALRMIQSEFTLANLGETLSQNTSHMEGSHYDPVIIKQGELCEETDCIFMLESGIVEVIVTAPSGEETVLEELSMFAVFGADCCLGVCAKHLTTVQAKEDCVLWVLPRHEVDELHRRFPEDCAWLSTRLVAQLQDLSVAFEKQLTQINFFAECSSACVAEIVECIKISVISPGQPIMEEGTLGDCMVILLNGTLNIEVGGKKVKSTSECGSYFGELSCLGLMQQRMATVRCAPECDCVLGLLSQEDFEAALCDFPEERARFQDVARSRLEEITYQKMALYSFGPLESCHERFLYLLTLDTKLLTVPQGETMPGGGVSSQTLFILRRGKAFVTGEGGEAYELKEGHAHHDWAEHEQVQTVTAKTNCDFFAIPRSALINGLIHFPKEVNGMQALVGRKVSIQELMDTNVNQILRESLQASLNRTAGFSDAFMRCLELISKPRLFFRDETLMIEGAEEDFMGLLLRGSVGIYANETIVRDARAPTWFGDLAMLGLSSKRTATVRARTICEARFLHRDDLFRAFVDFPSQRQNFDRLAQERLQLLSSQVSRGFSLSQLKLFHDCQREFLLYIENNLSSVAFLPEADIIEEGTEGDCMYILISGKAECIAGGSRVGELNEGSAFGEMVFFGEPVRTATVRALSVCVCRVLYADAFNQALGAFPHERRKFEEIVSARKQAMNTLVGINKNQDSKNNELLGNPRSSLLLKRIRSVKRAERKQQITRMYDENALSSSAMRALTRRMREMEYPDASEDELSTMALRVINEGLGSASSGPLPSMAEHPTPRRAKRPGGASDGAERLMTMRQPPPELPPVIPQLYSAGKAAQSKHTLVFNDILRTPRNEKTKLDEGHADSSVESPPLPGRERVTIYDSSLPLAPLWSSNNIMRQHGTQPTSARYLRCRPTYTSPLPKLIARAPQRRIPHRESDQMQNVARAVYDLSNCLLRIHRKDADSTVDSLRRVSSAPASARRSVVEGEGGQMPTRSVSASVLDNKNNQWSSQADVDPNTNAQYDDGSRPNTSPAVNRQGGRNSNPSSNSVLGHSAQDFMMSKGKGPISEQPARNTRRNQNRPSHSEGIGEESPKSTDEAMLLCCI